MNEEVFYDEQRKWLCETESIPCCRRTLYCLSHQEAAESIPGENYWNDNKGFRILHKLNWWSSSRVWEDWLILGEVLLWGDLLDHRKSKGIPENSASLTTPKPLCGSQQTVEDSERDGIPSYPLPKKPVCGSRSKLELDMEQWMASKWGKEYIKAVYCHPSCLTYMQSTLWEMPR